jgi:hypothetical protein
LGALDGANFYHRVPYKDITIIAKPSDSGLSKGSKRIGDSFPSPEDGIISGISFFWYLEFRTMNKVHKTSDSEYLYQFKQTKNIYYSCNEGYSLKSQNKNLTSACSKQFEPHNGSL